jgi:L-aspartate oxidase
MSAHVGVVRTAAGLRRALADILRLEGETQAAPQLRNMATAALMVAAAALERAESRGGHTRSDFPHADPRRAKRTFMTLAEARRIAAAVRARELEPTA